MTSGGWVILLGSVGAVTLLFGWCVIKVMKDPQDPEQTLHGFDPETPDLPRDGEGGLDRSV